MAKIHPNSTSLTGAAGILKPCPCLPPPPTVLTVWKKSLLFNCDGFTVFDDKGNLAFRVDNYYQSTNRAEIVLMDASGNSLLTIRRKKLGIAVSWVVYDGETVDHPLYCVRKRASLLNSKSLAHVTSLCGGGDGVKRSKSGKMYSIEGSYADRTCAVYDHTRLRVAEIKLKETAVGGVCFGRDVFRLIVQPEIDPPVAMAVVVLLDQMFGS